MEHENNQVQTVNVKSVLDRERENQMCENPFLFNTEDSNKMLIFFEDFYVKYKEKYILLEDVIRSDQFSPFEKKKILNNQLLVWKKDAERGIFESLKNSKECLLRCKKSNFKSIGPKCFVFLIIGIIIPILILMNIIPIVLFEKQYINMGCYGVIILSITGILFAIVQNYSGKKFESSFGKNKRLYNRIKKSIYKKLSKNCKFIKKYYFKDINKKLFLKESISLEKINDVSKQLLLLKKSSAELEKQYNKLINKNNNRSLYYVLAIISTVIVSITSIGYLILVLVMNIIQKLI